MYDFAEVHTSTMQIVEALATSLSAIGLDAHAEVPNALVHEELMNVWRSPDMVLSQACGLPFVEELHHFVNVIGTPVWTDVSDDRGGYQTVIVVRESLQVSNIAEVGGLRPVVSNSQSLSGWCSLGIALSDTAIDPSFVQPFAHSGGHARSLQMLQDGKADIASIDAATFRLLKRHRPALTNDLQIIARGPLVPATPFVLSKTCGVSTDEVFQAVEEVFQRQGLREAFDNIGISGFVRLTNSDFDGVMELVKSAEVVLPRQ